MGKARIAMRNRKQEDTTVPVEERWVVIGGPGSHRPGFPVFLPSKSGIDRESAEALSSRLAQSTEVVPFLSLDQDQNYSTELHRAWEEKMAASEEE